MTEGEKPKEQSKIERILAVVMTAELTGEELSLLANKITVLASEKRASEKQFNESERRADISHESKLEGEESKNSFGLPHSWARRTSLEGLDLLRKSLQRAGSVVDYRVINAATNDYLRRVRPEYIQYRGVDAVFEADVRGQAESGSVSSLGQAEALHLTMSSEERLRYLQERYPKGMPVLGENQFFRWDKIIDFELWALKNHSQTFATIARRGGLGPREAAAIVFCVPFPGSRYSEKGLMKFFKDSGFLVEEYNVL